MSSIHALRQRKVEIRRRTQAVIDAAQTQGRNLTPEESAAYERDISALQKLEVEIVATEAELERERKMPASVDENSAFARAAGVHNPAAGGDHGSTGERGFKARSAKYRDVFPDAPRSTGGFTSFNEFMSAWHNAPKQFDPRLKMSQGENVPSQGGFLVPDEYASMIMDSALENEIVRPRAQNWAMSSENRRIPAWDGFDHTSNLYGGFTAQWVNENSPITLQDAKTRLVKLSANKLALLGNASNELLADVPGQGFGAIYGAAMTAAISWFLDLYFLTGDGAGQPLGVLKDPALVVQAKDSGDATTAMTFKDIVAMFSRLHPASISNAVWVASSTTIPALMSLSNANAPLVPLVTQQSDGKLYMLSKEILFTEKLPTLGNQGDILLVDFSKYAIGVRQGTTLEQSSHAGFQSDQTYFRVVTRIDGQGTWKAPVTPKNGVSQSWCVTLAARP